MSSAMSVSFHGLFHARTPHPIVDQGDHIIGALAGRLFDDPTGDSALDVSIRALIDIRISFGSGQ